MSNLFRKGFRQAPQPTKGEVMDENSVLKQRLTNTESNIQFLASQIMPFVQRFPAVAREVDALLQLTASTEATRPAQENDYVLVSYLGVLLKEDGSPEMDEEVGLPAYFKDGHGENFAIMGLGGGTLVPGFEEQLVGMSAGESKDIVVTFPENYHEKTMAGRKARFTVEMRKVMQPLALSTVQRLKVAYDIAKAKAAQTKKQAESQNQNTASADAETKEQTKE